MHHIQIMKKIFTLTILFLLSVTALIGQVAENRIKISDFQVEDFGETIRIDFTANVSPKAVKRNHSLVFIPVIENDGYRQSLSPVVIQGKGSKIARERREWVAGQIADYENAVYAKNGETITLTSTVPFQKWMSGSDLILESVESGCCSYHKLNDVLYAENILERQEQEPEPVIVVVEKELEEWIPVSIADSLSTAFTFVVPLSEFDDNEPFKIYDDERDNSMVIYFRVAKYDIDATYMSNAHTLSNLTAVINMIMDAKYSKVDRIVVAGFASPEGGFELNDRLAFERAVSVKKYLMETTDVRDNQIMVFNGSLDWRGLRSMIVKSNLPEKRQILSIIDNTPIWDSKRQVGRLGELMRFNGGRTYRYLLNEYFPYLRNGAFIKVYYDNVPSAN